jgi:glucosamine-6-phosphate deaminase
MGLGTIAETWMLLMLTFGKEKAGAIGQALEGPLTAVIPASALQLHPNAVGILDPDAVRDLKYKTYYRQQAAT